MSARDSSAERTDSFPLATYMRVLRDRKWWVLGVLLPIVALVLLYSYAWATPQYGATASILRQTTSFDRGLFDTQLFAPTDVGSDLQTGSRLVKLDVVAQMVKEDLNSPRSGGSLLEMISVDRGTNTQILEIRAVSTDAQEAAAVSNSFASQFIRYRQEADRAALSQARAQIEEELASMTAADRASDRGVILTQKAEELRIIESMQTGGYEIVQTATIPDEPFAPRPIRNGMVAGGLGLFSGVLLAFVVDRLDRRIKTVDALEEEIGLPVLAAIPQVGSHVTPAEGEPVGLVTYTHGAPQFVEAFRALRSNLKYFEFDRQVKTILVTSGLPQEGKTVTTVNLAISLAMAGARVTVLEADLRRPMVHRYLGVPSRRGISDVLAGALSLQEALQSVEIDHTKFTKPRIGSPPASPAFLNSSLFCLASGPLPPNPAEFLGSDQMKWLIQDAAELGDYVLIDTPPVLLVSDALSLVGQVDAVIVCARLNSTTKDEARQLHTLLERTGAHALGVVAGGVKGMDESTYHSYGYFLNPETPNIELSPEGGTGDGSDHVAKRRTLPKGF